MRISIEGVNKDENLLSALCIIPISVGQDYHKKDLFSKTLDQLSRKGFRHFLVVVADTLQRHMLALSEPTAKSEDMLLQAKMAGDQWLEDTKEIFEDFKRINGESKKLTIVRWETWQDQAVFEDQLTKIQDKYANDTFFHSAIDKVVTRFVHGFLTAHPGISFNRERAAALSQEYILEEAAVISIWANTTDAQPQFHGYQSLYMAYPFGNHPTNNAIYQYLSEILNESNFRLINIHIRSQAAQKTRYKPDIKSEIPMGGVPLSPEDEAQLRLVLASMFGSLHAVLASNTLSPAARLALAQKMLNEAQKLQLDSVSLLALKDQQSDDNQADSFLAGPGSVLFNQASNSGGHQQQTEQSSTHSPYV